MVSQHMLLPPAAVHLPTTQREFGACDEEWMKDGNYCLYTCGRAKNCGGEQEEGQPEGQSTKPGNRSVCDDIRPPGEYTCEQQVRGPSSGDAAGRHTAWGLG